MKKLILAFTLLLTTAINAQAQNCGCLKVKNFTSVCNNSSPREFIVSFSVESQVGNTIEVSTTNGTINGSATKSFTHTPPQTDLQLVYKETTISSTFDFTVTIKDARGTIVCSETRKSDVLADCGKDCGSSWVNIYTPSQCTHKDGASKANSKDTLLGIHGGISAGPGKATSYSTTVTDIQRRELCTGKTAGAWQSCLAAMPIATVADMGSTYATGITPTSVNGTGFNSSADYFLYLKLPAKINPRQPCLEEYKITLSITVKFENGCTKTITHTVSYLSK